MLEGLLLVLYVAVVVSHGHVTYVNLSILIVDRFVFVWVCCVCSREMCRLVRNILGDGKVLKNGMFYFVQGM